MLHCRGTIRVPVRSIRITSVFFCLLRGVCVPSRFMKIKYYSYGHLDLPTLQQIHELHGERVHFLVPLGEPHFLSRPTRYQFFLPSPVMRYTVNGIVIITVQSRGGFEVS
jgi:hypothetical protein